MTFLILFVLVIIVLTADLYCGGFRQHLGGDRLSGGRRPVRGENCGDCRTDDCGGGSGSGARATSFKGIHRKVGHLRVGSEYVGDVLALAPGQCSTPFTILFFILEPTIGGLIILIILVILFGPGRLFSVSRRIRLLVEAGRLDQLVVLLKEVVDRLPRARLAQLQPRAAKVIHVDHLLLLAVFALLPQLFPLSPLLLASPLAARAGVGVGVIGKGQRAQLVHLFFLVLVVTAALVAASQLVLVLLFLFTVLIIIIEVVVVIIAFLVKEGANLIANKAIVSWTSFGGSLSTTSTSSGRRCGLLLLLIMRSFASLFQALISFSFLPFFLFANEILRANVTVAELPLLPCGQLLRLQALKLLAQADVLEVEAFDK